MLFIVLLETRLQFFRFFRIALYVLKAVSATSLKPRGRVASVQLQDKKWLGTVLEWRSAYYNVPGHRFPDDAETRKYNAILNYVFLNNKWNSIFVVIVLTGFFFFRFRSQQRNYNPYIDACKYIVVHLIFSQHNMVMPRTHIISACLHKHIMCVVYWTSRFRSLFLGHPLPLSGQRAAAAVHSPSQSRFKYNLRLPELGLGIYLVAYARTQVVRINSSPFHHFGRYCINIVSNKRTTFSRPCAGIIHSTAVTP
jgi:hypothetical protein